MWFLLMSRYASVDWSPSRGITATRGVLKTPLNLDRSSKIQAAEAKGEVGGAAAGTTPRCLALAE